MRQLVLSLTAGMLLVAAAPPAFAQNRADFTGWVDTTFTFDRNGKVELEQLSGDVVVTTWDRDEIRIRAYAERVPLETRFSRSNVYVGLDIPERRGRNNNRVGDSRFEITMPAGARISAGSVSGDVSVVGAAGRVSVSSVSGDVVVEGGSEELAATSVSGDMRLTGARGRIAINTVSGDVVLSDAEGDVTASAVSGDLTMRGVRSRLVTVKSVSGDLELDGPIRPGSRHELSSHSGTLTLRLPADVNGTLSISTFSGEIDSDLPMTLGTGSRRDRGSSTIEVQLGSGSGASIVAKTFSGEVVIRRSR